MQGTLVCGVTDGADNDDAVAQAAEVSERLGLRLVLAHVTHGIAALDNGADESVTMQADRTAGERTLRELAREHALGETAERRVAVGDPATLLGQIASEEAADMIVVGTQTRGWRGRGLDSRLAQDLETETPVPVLIAPARRPGRAGNRRARVASRR